MLNQIQIQAILKGTGYTVIIAVVAVIIGAVLGMLVALGRISKNKMLNRVTWIYVWIFRGTPLLLQLFMIYYAFPLIVKDLLGRPFPIHNLMACFIAFSLNSTAYMAEFFRAGIESIDKGQMEAARALGMSYNQAMFKVIIPQSYKRLLPSVGNEFIMLIKDTSLASTVALSDLLRTTKTMSSSSGKWIYYVYAAVIYLILTSIIQYGFEKVEKKVGAYE